MIDFSKLFIDDNIQPYFENLKNQFPVILDKKTVETLLNNIGENNLKIIEESGKKFSHITVINVEQKNNELEITYESENDKKVISFLETMLFKILKLPLNRYILEKASMEERKENKK